MKIDIKKDFDTINWKFLIHVLTCFGFSKVFCDWITNILKSAKISIHINGKAVGFFNCTRGVRQGDPLSPILFCLAEEVISRGLSTLVREGRLTQTNATKNHYFPSHCLYADDILIFCKGTQSNIRNIMHLFELYGQYSGQLVNVHKSRFYSGALSMSRIHTLTSITGFNHGQLPFMYLGILLFKGKPKAVHLRPIVDKIKQKLSTWKGMLLTIMGRVQLINAVISCMFTYSFHIYQWPSSLLIEVAKCMRNFIWSGNIEDRKICTVAWNSMCKSRDEGGLSVRDPAKINQAALMLLTWQLWNSTEQWAYICRQRFLRNGSPKSNYLTSSIWPGLKKHTHMVLEHSIWSIGNGERIYFWTDRWVDR